jgi:hypothetical protein
VRWVPHPTDSYSDPALAEAGEAAELLHRRAWDWCGHQETDGFVPAAMVGRLCPNRVAARVAALVRVGKWVAVDGGYRLAEWEEAMADLRSLLHRRKSDAERQRRRRADPKPERDPSEDGNTDGSRRPSRDGLPLEEKRDTPLTPRRGRGECDPANPIHDNCRPCGTTPRQRAAAAAATAENLAAQQLADLERRRQAVEWCGDEDCDPRWRKVLTADGLVPCPNCHPDLVVGPLPSTRAPLVAVGAR